MTPTIVEVTAAPLRRPEVLGRTVPPTVSWDSTGMMHALSSDRSFAGQAMRFEPPWDDVLCVVTASDGSFGVGMTSQAGPVVPIINDFFGPMIVGESVLAVERLWNMMSRSANSAFGAAGLAAYALSAVDLALWDLKGKVLGRPVYEIIGGPAQGAHTLLRDWQRPRRLAQPRIRRVQAGRLGRARIRYCWHCRDRASGGERSLRTRARCRHHAGLLVVARCVVHRAPRRGTGRRTG